MRDGEELRRSGGRRGRQQQAGRPDLVRGEHWNGKSWTVRAVPAPAKGHASVLNGVSCLSAANCLAVGQFGPFNSDEGNGLAGFWNGKRRGLATTP